jgi:YD repeat-containing protein
VESADVRGNLVIIAVVVAIASISLRLGSARLIDDHVRAELQARGSEYQPLLNAARGAASAYAGAGHPARSRQAGGLHRRYDAAGRLVASSGPLP